MIWRNIFSVRVNFCNFHSVHLECDLKICLCKKFVKLSFQDWLLIPMEFDQFKIKFSSIWHASNTKSTMWWPTFSIVFKEPSNVYGDKKGSRMSSCVIDDSAKKCSTINNGFCHFMSPQEEEKGHKMKILSLNFVSVQSKFAIFMKIPWNQLFV